MFHLLVVTCFLVSSVASQRNVSEHFPNPANDKRLVECLHTHQCTILGVGMLNPTRLLLIVDQPLVDDGTIHPPGCCDADQYFVFENDVPPGNLSKRFRRTFPLSGAVPLKSKWPLLYVYLKKFFKNIWPRFFVLRGESGRMYLILYTNEIEMYQPRFTMDLRSLLKLLKTGTIYMQALYGFGDPPDVDDHPSMFDAVHSLDTGFMFQNRTPTDVLDHEMALYGWRQVYTTPGQYINEPASVGFDDGSSGIYWLDCFQKTIWAVSANFTRWHLNGSTHWKVAPWRTNISISQLFVLKGSHTDTSITSSSRGRPMLIIALGFSTLLVFAILFIVGFVFVCKFCDSTKNPVEESSGNVAKEVVPPAPVKEQQLLAGTNICLVAGKLDPSQGGSQQNAPSATVVNATQGTELFSSTSKKRSRSKKGKSKQSSSRSKTRLSKFKSKGRTSKTKVSKSKSKGGGGGSSSKLCKTKRSVSRRGRSRTSRTGRKGSKKRRASSGTTKTSKKQSRTRRRTTLSSKRIGKSSKKL